MKFVFVSYDYHADLGPPDAWLNRIKGYIGVLECLAKNHTVTRITQTNYFAERDLNGVTYRFLNYGTNSLRFPWRLHKFIASMQPDVVVVHGLHNPLQIIQLKFQLNKKTRIIAQNHAEKPAVGIRKQLQKIADRYIDAYLFASKAMGLEWVTKGNLASPNKIHEVMEVSSVFYPLNRVDAIVRTGVSGAPAFLWVGRLNDNKDPLNVIKTFLRFAEVYPTARLYMIYHTDELLGDIKALLKQSPDGRTVTLVGKTPHNDLPHWYNSVDFVVSGSFYEGSGTAICEAMSCGCIPVVTDIFSFRVMTDNGRCGILYEAGNGDALLAALVKSQQADVPAMRRDILSHYRAKLSFEAIAARFEAIAHSL